MTTGMIPRSVARANRRNSEGLSLPLGKQRFRWRILAMMLLLASAPAGLAQSLSGNQVWTYTLVDGSYLAEECLICGLPPISTPIRGTFTLKVQAITPLFISYSMENISFASASTNGQQYQVTGSGLYQLGGEVAAQQQVSLALTINDGVASQVAYFTNGPVSPGRPWPMIQANANQTNGTVGRTYILQLNAAPFQELWFSTQTGFYAGKPQSETNLLSPGDLLSSVGRVVRRNAELAARLGIMPIVPDLGLDAVDILPGGEIAFSIDQDMFSETLGQLHEGDVLSDQGRIIAGYTNLLAAFGPGPSPADPGLDALQIQDSGEIYFSVKTNFFSNALGASIGPGDLLSSLGYIVKTNAELLARFHPADPAQDYGLEAVWVWPSGEIWFSTEKPFQDSQSTSYSPGDLLSDQGYVVYHNAELLCAAMLPAGGEHRQFQFWTRFTSSLTQHPPPPRRKSRSPRQTLRMALSVWRGRGKAVFSRCKARQTRQALIFHSVPSCRTSPSKTWEF